MLMMNSDMFNNFLSTVYDTFYLTVHHELIFSPQFIYSRFNLIFGFTVSDMVPYLKSVISTMLPLLCLVKQGDMKWIFAYGKQILLLNFCAYYYYCHYFKA